MKLDLSLKSPVPNEAIVALQQSIADWQADNPDFEDELYQVITFYVLETLITFDLVTFKIWVAGMDIQENEYSLTNILEPLPWTLQGIQNNLDFDWFFAHHLKQTNVNFIYQNKGLGNDNYLVKVISDNVNDKDLEELISKHDLVEILTDLKLTFEQYVKQHLAHVLPKDYLAMFDNFYHLIW